ncbi:hypothetical protein DPMN_135217 [Dreissena polymorpha]|uniref:Uncharacterized protein n=1 Tax=Dreissena polymorpha TaxID=45954 RepID=A0A9D4FX64_DREPO|nr:hypothetical protein DPMN_135217 [Dreissena polymorpha]
MSKKWEHEFNKFCSKGCDTNATFALHLDITNNCDEIVGIEAAERIGGKSGYNLLLASVKKSCRLNF